MSTLNQNNTAKVRRLYGGAVTDQAAYASVNTAGQAVAETLQVSATANARRFKGPIKNGHVSVHWYNATASGATSAMTVWYSNLPDPDPATDAHWVQDSGVSSVDMTTTATGTFINIGNVCAAWVRLKPNVATSAGTAWCWVHSEGVEV